MSDEKTTTGQAPEQEGAPVLPMKLDVSVRPIEPKGNLVGFASLKINDSFVIDDFKILQGDKGLLVGMPSKPDRNSKTGYRDTARPITKEFRAELTGAVTTAYREAVEKLQARARKGRQNKKRGAVTSGVEVLAKPSGFVGRGGA
ncbi:MAG: SpoVG family protein [Ethanoligenens sp.]